MGTPFLGEIKIISFNFAPKGWALCNGQFLPINQNQALFSLLGTTYGGNGQTTFALPDLRGRVPMPLPAAASTSARGRRPGVPHRHPVRDADAHPHAAGVSTPAGRQPASGRQRPGPLPPATGLHRAGQLHADGAEQRGQFGGSQPHENRQPFLVLNFIIALQGIFPSQN